MPQLKSGRHVALSVARYPFYVVVWIRRSEAVRDRGAWRPDSAMLALRNQP